MIGLATATLLFGTMPAPVELTATMPEVHAPRTRLWQPMGVVAAEAFEAQSDDSPEDLEDGTCGHVPTVCLLKNPPEALRSQHRIHLVLWQTVDEDGSFAVMPEWNRARGVRLKWRF